jgi:hypothetical protein
MRDRVRLSSIGAMNYSIGAMNDSMGVTNTRGEIDPSQQVQRTGGGRSWSNLVMNIDVARTERRLKIVIATPQCNLFFPTLSNTHARGRSPSFFGHSSLSGFPDHTTDSKYWRVYRVKDLWKRWPVGRGEKSVAQHEFAWEVMAVRASEEVTEEAVNGGAASNRLCQKPVPTACRIQLPFVKGLR